MFHRKRPDLRERAREAGLGTWDIGVVWDEPASTVAARLNGYLPLTAEHEQKLNDAINREMAERNRS